MPDREWVRSERRAINPTIRKKEDELRLDSWIQIKSTGWDERKCSSVCAVRSVAERSQNVVCSSVLLARRPPAFH